MEHLAQTAPQVYQGFLDGDFVAKEAKHSFNEVPFDLCLEHINKTGKVAGGLSVSLPEPVAASAAGGSQRGQWQPARPVAASAASGSQRGQWQPARLACRRS
ncbi:unnamed protein product [Gadus morhua 'NCC']